MTRLINLKRELVGKYPNKRDRVEYITDILMNKLEHLRTYTLPDYIRTIHLACKEFGEFEALIPSEEEVDDLIRDEEITELTGVEEE
jgi:hypothetical protein